MASHVVRHVLHQAIDHGGAPHRRRTEGEGRRGIGEDVVREISALKGDGIHELLRVISKKVLENDLNSTSSLIPNERQKIALEEAYEYFKNAANNLKEDLPTEIIAVDLKSGLDSLSEITGETANDMIYERIFSKFCIGK